MSMKRRDSKGRILKTGESQRKDGRYLYKYVDSFGQPQSIYSWKLVPTDRVPSGKRDCISLREKVAEIQKDIYDGIDIVGKKMTLCQLYAKQNAQRPNVKKGTKVQRKILMGILERDKLGARSIDTIKQSDAIEWVLRMYESGYAYSSITSYHICLRASFKIAIQDDCVRKNPFDFQLSAVLDDDTIPTEPLTEDEERRLFDFIKNDRVYRKHHDVILVLLKTGLRISEFCGLTLKDLDFEKGLININHQLKKDKDGYYVDTTKTKSGERLVPMIDDVVQALRRMIETRNKPLPLVIDGYSDFLSINSKGKPLIGSNYYQMLTNLVKKYNKYHDDKLPHITPHVLRHTFCTRLANKNMNPKSLQYIMGHSCIAITLNLYAHASLETVQAEMIRLSA